MLLLPAKAVITKLPKLPVNDVAVIAPAEKLPEASRLTIVDAVLRLVAAVTKSVKYLPPITTWLTALPLVSVPIPMYRRSPPFEPLSGKAEYANSPAPSVLGLPETEERFILIIAAIFYPLLKFPSFDILLV